MIKTILLSLAVFVTGTSFAARKKHIRIGYSLEIGQKQYAVTLQYSDLDTLSFSGDYFGDSVAEVQYFAGGSRMMLRDGRIAGRDSCSFLFDTFVKFGGCSKELYLAKPVRKCYKGFCVTKYYHTHSPEYSGRLISTDTFPLELIGSYRQEKVLLKTVSVKRRRIKT